jgi:HAE1 family hydrophobic/amphiphilic exporter-1
MTISEICIRRPVFTWVLVAVPVVLGLVAYNELGVDEMPNVDMPVCSITTSLSGASVEEMETSVTKVIEDVINSVSGIDEVRSTTTEGVSIVTVQFQLSKSGDVGTQEVRDKVNTILGSLPTGTSTPVINRFASDSIPILTLAVSGRRDFREVTEIARKRIKERLETISGVGAVTLIGGRTRAMNVVVDTDRLSGYGLSIDDVRLALTRQNLEVPGGRVDQGSSELVLRTLGRLSDENEFNQLIISNHNGYPVRISDVGTARDSYEEPRSLARLDGRNAVSLSIQKQSGTNTVAVADAIQTRIEELKKDLPSDIEVMVIKDRARFIRQSIEEVKFHLLLAAGLVSVTILLFIRDWRTTLIATLAIPTSIIPTFLFMKLMGYTLNNMTMLGLILAIGIVIDDAVVVHENIFRHMEEDGMDGMTAAQKGTREIALAVLATSLSLMVIFLPVGFMGGMVGRFFSSFGLTVAFAVGMSLFVSFTLTPMLCSRFLKLEPGTGHAKSKDGLFWRLVDGSYGWILRGALRFKWLVVLITLGVIASTAPIAGMLGVEFMPRDDQSEYELSIITPEGYALERTDQICRELEARLWKLPESKHVFVTIGSNSGTATKGAGDVTRASLYVRISPLGTRSITQFQVQDLARAVLKDFPELRSSVNDVSPFGGSGDRSQQFQMNVSGPDLTALATTSQHVIQELARSGNLADLDTTLSLRKPEVQVAIDREAASDLGIPVSTIADTLRVLVGGLPITNFRDQSEQYDVWLRAQPGNRSTPQELLDLTIASPTAGLVKLSSVAHLKNAQGPSEITRLNRDRVVTILGNPVHTSLNGAVAETTAILEGMKLPAAYSYSVAGQAKRLSETGYYLVIAFVLSLVFMYMILAAQFESWLQPVAIMMALPVTIPFGLLSLVLWRTSLDLYAMFGLFMLVGIVKKNGILQVDKANQNRLAGMNRLDAVIDANHTRLRPILMTTLMLVAAMVPIALGQGPGSGARASMARVIIGGQMLSLVLSLIVTPVFYILLDQVANLAHRMGIRFSVQPLRPAAPAVEPALALAGSGTNPAHP